MNALGRSVKWTVINKIEVGEMAKRRKIIDFIWIQLRPEDPKCMPSNANWHNRQIRLRIYLWPHATYAVMCTTRATCMHAPFHSWFLSHNIFRTPRNRWYRARVFVNSSCRSDMLLFGICSFMGRRARRHSFRIRCQKADIVIACQPITNFGYNNR